MEPKYIIAISALALFFVLFIIFIVLLAIRRRREAKLKAWLHEFYSDKNLVKQDYETSGGNDDALSTERIIRSADDELYKEKKESEEVQLKIEEVFPKIETEGIEEITGNYNPQQ